MTKIHLTMLLLIMAVPALGEEVQFSKLKVPQVVTVDRRPNPNVVYSRCFGVFEIEAGKETVAGVKTTGDRTCPDPKTVKADITAIPKSSVKTTTDNGETVTDPVEMSLENVEKKADFKGKTYFLLGGPSRITVNNMVNGKPEKVDSFYVMVAFEEGNEDADYDRSMLFACDDPTTLKSCIESRIQSHKPLAVGKVDNVLPDASQLASVPVDPKIHSLGIVNQY